MIIIHVRNLPGWKGSHASSANCGYPGEVQEEFMHQTTSNIVHIMLCGKDAEYRVPKTRALYIHCSIFTQVSVLVDV